MKILACEKCINDHAQYLKNSGRIKNIKSSKSKFIQRISEDYTKRVVKPLVDTFRSDNWKPGVREAKNKYKEILQSEVTAQIENIQEIAALALFEYKSEYDRMKPRLVEMRKVSESEKEQYIGTIRKMQRKLQMAKNLDWSKHRVQGIEEVLAHVPENLDIPNIAN